MQINVDMTIRTCSCGSVYGVPAWTARYKCPMCAFREAEATGADLTVSYEEQERLKRVIASLRGALTKMRRARR